MKIELNEYQFYRITRLKSVQFIDHAKSHIVARLGRISQILSVRVLCFFRIYYMFSLNNNKNK